jgi:cytochrome c peroxidase
MSQQLMKSARICAIVLALLVQTSPPASGQSDLWKQAKSQFAPLPKVIASTDNPVTAEKTRLGKMLFYETRVSVDGTVSCFKCHVIPLYGTDGLPKAIGNQNKVNPRNAPTVLNAAGQISEHWIGNRSSVEDQAKQALIGPPSFGLALYEDAVRKLNAVPDYAILFRKAFPESRDPVSVDNFANAIGTWERTLVTPARFDKFLEGDASQLKTDESMGLKDFMGTGCVMCHSGTYVGGQSYRKFGITQPYWELTHSAQIDSGRYVVTHKEDDRFVFKVPTLRNVEMTSPYFHDGSIDSLSAAVRIMAQLQLGSTLDDTTTKAIVAFLKSLTGKIPQDALEVPILPSKN